MVRTIEVAQYDDAWKSAFEREALDLGNVFRDSLLFIHHIGSTAIPGLFAKPIIDILVVINETKTIERFNNSMEQLGYRTRGECLDAEIPGTPGRFYFSKDSGEVRTHQVHVCAAGHPEVADKLAFRDYLRAHPDRANAYGSLKQCLARLHPHDIVGYMRGKDEFIKETLGEARRWIG